MPNTTSQLLQDVLAQDVEELESVLNQDSSCEPFGPSTEGEIPENRLSRNLCGKEYHVKTVGYMKNRLKPGS
jgi:hypothetical protein